MTRPSDLDLNGEPPSLAALRCQGFLCQAFIYDGKVLETANVVHMRFDDIWHRLYFDFGVIFWRISDEDPKFWPNKDDDWVDPFIDIGVSLDLIGKTLASYEMESVQTKAKVTFVFEAGPTIVVESLDDITNFRVVSPA